MGNEKRQHSPRILPLRTSSVRRISKRGGYFERVRSMQTSLTRIFIDLECLGKLGNSKLFSAQTQVISKKKKKKGFRQNSELFFGRNPKFKAFFCPKSGDLQTKQNKKKVFAKIQSYFSAEIRNLKLFSVQNRVISQKKKKKKEKRKKKGLYSRSVPFFIRTHSNFQPKARTPDAQLTKGGAMPQFCSPYYAILQS